ncbi:MAG: hypothetical protein AVDCRST_MAG35-234, partial [uncultured Quadrisphaera sp.]
GSRHRALRRLPLHRARSPTGARRGGPLHPRAAAGEGPAVGRDPPAGGHPHPAGVHGPAVLATARAVGGRRQPDGVAADGLPAADVPPQPRRGRALVPDPRAAHADDRGRHHGAAPGRHGAPARRDRPRQLGPPLEPPAVVLPDPDHRRRPRRQQGRGADPALRGLAGPGRQRGRHRLPRWPPLRPGGAALGRDAAAAAGRARVLAPAGDAPPALRERDDVGVPGQRPPRGGHDRGRQRRTHLHPAPQRRRGAVPGRGDPAADQPERRRGDDAGHLGPHPGRGGVRQRGRRREHPRHDGLAQPAHLPLRRRHRERAVGRRQDRGAPGRRPPGPGL